MANVSLGRATERIHSPTEYEMKSEIQMGGREERGGSAKTGRNGEKEKIAMIAEIQMCVYNSCT